MVGGVEGLLRLHWKDGYDFPREKSKRYEKIGNQSAGGRSELAWTPASLSVGEGAGQGTTFLRAALYSRSPALQGGFFTS